MKNLILTGMMGVGKTTIGKIVAKSLNLNLLTLTVSSKKRKNTIKEIFRNNGEDYFRKIETKITLSELKKVNLVIALEAVLSLTNQLERG